jgi:hypothetical protein
MKVILEVTSGPDAPRSFVIEPGEEVRIGRTPPARILLAKDRTVSRVHFALNCDGRSCRIRDLGSTHGTTVNGLRVADAYLAEGDLIVAGTTGLRVSIGEDLSTEGLPRGDDTGWPDALPATEHRRIVETGDHEVLAQEPTLHDRVLDVLRSQKEPLFAILDAARDPLVYLRITACKERKQSLYEGPEADRLSFFAPYLISLPRNSPFLEQLVREGWGNAWGVYLSCDKPFEEVRRHLRHFLMVELGEKKQKVLFRFYDPRVLREFLPTCSGDQAPQFFGPIGSILLEGDASGELTRYRCVRSALEQSSRLLASTANSPDPGRGTTG